MKQQYVDILENARQVMDNMDPDEFLDKFLKLQGERSMQVYSVGEFCQHEGGGWDSLVADNENTFKNIQKVLIDHHQEQVTRYEGWAEERDGMEWQKDIDGHKEIIDLVKNATRIEDINNKEIPPWNHDVIRINKQTIIS